MGNHVATILLHSAPKMEVDIQSASWVQCRRWNGAALVGHSIPAALFDSAYIRSTMALPPSVGKVNTRVVLCSCCYLGCAVGGDQASRVSMVQGWRQATIGHIINNRMAQMMQVGSNLVR